jgi:site-specific DNA-methyltransferase (adenine-specific)
MPWAVFGIWKQQLPRGTKACLIWDKGPAFGCGDLRFPWKPSWEQIYIGGTGWKGKRDEGVLRGECVVSWESKGRMHPHQKPVWLYERLLAKQPEAKVVIDPFAGIGPCGLAGKRLGKKCVLVEIEERYCEIAANRLRQGCLL